MLIKKGRLRIRSLIYQLLPHILTVVLIILSFISDNRTENIAFLAFLAFIELVVILRRNKWETNGVFSILLAIILLWKVYISFISPSQSFLLAPPEKVFGTLWTDILIILKSILSSSWMLALSFVIAVILGTSLALLCGYFERLKNLVTPVADILSAIPALIYAPYAVMVLPGFRTAAIFVITSGLFWPILINTMKTIDSISSELSDYAKTLNLSRRTMIMHILLPYCTPGLFNTMAMQISNAFLLLVGAELMGMTSGVGWYVKYNADFSNYTKVLAGFIVIGILVSLVNGLLGILRRKVVVWERQESI